MSSQNRDRILLRSLAPGVLEHLEDERILLFDFPHLIKQVGGRSSRPINAPASNAARDMRSNAIGQRQLDVLRKISQ